MRRLELVIFASALGLFACRDDTTAPDTSSIQAPSAKARTTEGWLQVLWGDPAPNAGRAPIVRYELVEGRGKAVRLEISEDLAARHGGSRALDRRRVRIQGRLKADGALRVESLAVDRAAGGGLAAITIGSKPYVTIGCKFADLVEEPEPITTYTRWTNGTTYPGLNHFWRQLSFGRMDVAGSTVVGWYTLPFSKAHYVSDSNADLNAMAIDCTNAADADVYFPQYFGINLQFNAYMDYSWGGGWWTDLDGQGENYGMTWMASWAGFSVYAHEEGHAFGLPHSSGPYSATYDSYWDVMSSPYPFYDETEQTYIPTHTIAFHKLMLGWLDQGIYVAPPDSRRSLVIERLENSGPGYRMALIPLEGTNQYVEYTLETRRQVGKYDAHVPGNALVIHHVDQGRGDRRAQVVDPDGNGDPNDAGAMWTPGETFADAAHGISVRIDSMTATGYGVTITRTSTNLWQSMTPMPRARKAFALGVVSGILYAAGGIGSGPALGTMDAYSPATNAWTSKAAMPAARYDADGSATLGGLMYLPGGRNAAGVLTRTLYAYNPSTNTWTTRAQLPLAGGCGGSGAIGGRLYVLTGCYSTGWAGRLHQYNPATDRWATRAAAPAAHGYPAVGVIGGLLYVAGGRNVAGVVTATLHSYSPGTNTWSELASMPAPRFAAAGRVLDGKLYVVGGNSGQAMVATTFVYDPATNSWSTKTPMPAARAKLGAGSAGGFLYAVGGQTGARALTAVERYTP
jgi:M6 family metalloprotease-like protein